MKLAMDIERVPSPTLPAVPGSVARDRSLASNALILMANLEQLVDHLANLARPPSELLILEYLTHITNQIIAFVEQLPAPVQHLSLETLLGQEAVNYTQRHRLPVANGRLSTAPLAELSADPKALRGLCNDILRVIHIYLNIFVLTFHDAPLHEQWSALFKGFHDDLVMTVRALSPQQLLDELSQGL